MWISSRLFPVSPRSFNVVGALNSPVFDFHIAFFNGFHSPTYSD